MANSGIYVDDVLRARTDLAGWTLTWTHHPVIPGDGLFSEGGRRLTHVGNPFALFISISALASLLWLLPSGFGVYPVGVGAVLALVWPILIVLVYVVSAWLWTRARVAAARTVTVRVASGQLRYGAQRLSLGTVNDVVAGHGVISLFTTQGQLDLPNRGMAPERASQVVLSLRAAVALAGEPGEMRVPDAVRQLVGRAKQSSKLRVPVTDRRLV